jgi:hypothetical protein
MSENYRMTAWGEEMKCPDCGEWTHADFVDNGVGMQRCGPYGCERCGWVEEQNLERTSLSEMFAASKVKS